ncbi:hypothetical protein IF188_02985 [Microbacterium sp. NEAU-LLC]|uniref:DUF4352 domain-containing protein n=1 Tax=Microbacterium helvum TaxID=2773713 RepID=A0ABR8NJ05_9MICO|nr:hypothetical protein [Microbacterium helvum]MBD3940662.1 hypothetical protein [Microbacterium helvum]
MDQPVTGWWRSNAVALGAVLVLVPATYAAMAWNEWSETLQGTPTQPILLQPGESTEYVGATIGPVAAEYGEFPDAPQGGKVITVEIQIDPAGAEFACSTPELHETGGLERQWSYTTDLGREWDDDLHTGCDSELTEPYAITVDYLVAEDVSGPFTVWLASKPGLPEFVSAVVDP